MTDYGTTLAELVELLDRQRAALSEARRPDLANLVHLTITHDGQVHVVCAPRVTGDIADVDPVALKALSIDPVFEVGTNE